MKLNSDIDDLLAPEVRNQLLLYWSGELAPENKKAVEERLLVQPECRQYLHDLEGLTETFEAQVTPIAPSQDFAAQAVAQFAASTTSTAKAIAKEGAIIRLAWLKPLALAAAIVMTGFVGFQMGRQGGETKSAEVAGKVDIPKIADDFSIAPSEVVPAVVGKSRSARLFVSESRGADARLDATRRHLNKLRSKVQKS